MSNRLAEIAARKRALIEKADRERSELASAYDKIRSPIEISGTLLLLGRTLKNHPLVIAGISSLLMSGYAGKLVRSTKQVFGLWSVSRPVRNWWSKRRKSR